MTIDQSLNTMFDVEFSLVAKYQKRSESICINPPRRKKFHKISAYAGNNYSYEWRRNPLN